MADKRSREDIKLMKHAGSVVAFVHEAMAKAVQPGVSTKYLDEIAAKIIKDNKCIPTFLGYKGFPACICTSVNHQVVHGIPSNDVILKAGDIVSIDVGATFRGFVGDSAWTYAVGEVPADIQKLLKSCEKALMAAILQMKSGNNLNNVAGAIEDIATANNLGIVREYGGHGVGRSMHEDPFVFNYRTPKGEDFILKPGMTIAIEPMLNLGGDAVYVEEDNWTVSTVDRKPSAHFEHTILVGEEQGEILTQL